MFFDPDTQMGGPRDRFPSTRHSLVSAAALSPEALAEVLSLYWKPAYKYIRLQWHRSNEEAKDLTQSFFATALERDLLARFDPARASFRTYLRLCIDAFVQNEAAAARSAKRGGGVAHLPLDFAAAEVEIHAAEIAGAHAASTPEDLFTREWQRQIFSLAVDDLRHRAAAAQKQKQFAVFEAYDLASGDRPSYDELARRFEIPVTQVTNYLAWARRELRLAVREREAVSLLRSR